MMIFLMLTAAILQGNAAIPANGFVSQTPQASKILAKINGEAIKAADVEPYLWDWRGFEALQDVVSLRLATQAAEKAGIKLPDAEIAKAFANQLEQLKKGMPEGKPLDEALRDQGFPKSRLLMRVRTELLVDKIVMKNFKPSDYAKVSTMLFKPESEQTAALTAAIGKADESYKKLMGGAKWDIVLSESGAEQRVLSTKGMVGWRTISAFPPTVAANLVALKGGEYSKPAQTTNGIQIFRLEAMGASAAGQDLEELRSYYLTNTRPTFLNKLRSDAKIERFFP